MNAENFAEIIKNPSQLHQFSFQELKSLVLQYPYSQNLQLLLLVKSFQDQHKDFDKILARTSALSTDRRHLYHLLKTMEKAMETEESFELAEDYLELKELSSLEVELAEQPAADQPEVQASLLTPEAPSDLDSSFPDSGSFLTGEDPLEEEFPLVPVSGISDMETPPLDAASEKLISDLAAMCRLLTEKSVPEAKTVISDPLLKTLIAGSSLHAVRSRTDQAAPPPEQATPRPRPKPKTAFQSWSGTAKSTDLSLLADELLQPQQEDQEASKSKKKKKKKDAIIAFAERSLQEHEEIATETLADLLVQQESYDKAIQMYERLILIFPEKSSFFAEKIEALKKLS